MTDTGRPRCGECKWFEAEHDAVALDECRRHPPSGAIMDNHGFALWPRVRPSEWCGEFVRAEETADG